MPVYDLYSESFDRANAKWIEQGGSFEEAVEAVRRELQNRAESLTPWQAAKELEGIKREAQHLGEAPGVTAVESLDRLQSFLEGLEAIEKAFRKQRVSAQAAGVLKKAAELRQAMEEAGDGGKGRRAPGNAAGGGDAGESGGEAGAGAGGAPEAA